MTGSGYADIRNPNLQWGYWLHQDGQSPLLVDEEGRRWGSVREAFWGGRLGMCSSGRNAFMEVELERITAVLAAIDRRRVPIAEAVHDLFAGERRFEQFYKLWLHGLGLTAGDEPFGTALSAEGGAALIMLAATRPSRIKHVGVGLEAISTMMPDDTSEPELSAWLDRVAAAGRLRFRFVRHELWGKPAIALIGDGLGGEVPIRRTIWTQTFSDHGSRDGFLVWLAERLDRWEEWGRMAYERGASHFTQHLLATFVAGGGSVGASGRGATRLL